ncbi:hypothetical protein CRYUN_Cryun23aG0004700 [Craigia yunnanensis]
MKRVSVRSMLNDIAMFLRKNIRRVTLYSTISLALGMCYLLLKLTALPSPKIVPYSELITRLQSSSVTKVLLEEGSRRIYFNMDSKSAENTPSSEKESLAFNNSTENLAGMAARDDGVEAANSPAKKRHPNNQVFGFDDVEGVDTAKMELMELLTEMDGFESDMKVVVIGATNRPEALDPALCRPGRFSRKVLVREPDEEGRKKILAVHLRGVPLEEDTQLISDLVASLTPGFVGADLANTINEAALLAARRGSETVTREDIMEAVERAKFGINDRQPSTIGKELGKLFPWMPSLMGSSDTRQDGLQGPLGYQTLS